VPHTLGPEVAVPAAVVLLLLPGLAFLSLLRPADRARLGLDERLFLTGAISVAASSWVALVLAEFGGFGTARAALIEGVVVALALLAARLRGPPPVESLRGPAPRDARAPRARRRLRRVRPSRAAKRVHRGRSRSRRLRVGHGRHREDGGHHAPRPRRGLDSPRGPLALLREPRPPALPFHPRCERGRAAALLAAVHGFRARSPVERAHHAAVLPPLPGVRRLSLRDHGRARSARDPAHPRDPRHPRRLLPRATPVRQHRGASGGLRARDIGARGLVRAVSRVGRLLAVPHPRGTPCPPHRPGVRRARVRVALGRAARPHPSRADRQRAASAASRILGDARDPWAGRRLMVRARPRGSRALHDPPCARGGARGRLQHALRAPDPDAALLESRPAVLGSRGGRVRGRRLPRVDPRSPSRRASDAARTARASRRHRRSRARDRLRARPASFAVRMGGRRRQREGRRPRRTRSVEDARLPPPRRARRAGPAPLLVVRGRPGPRARLRGSRPLPAPRAARGSAAPRGAAVVLGFLLLQDPRLQRLLLRDAPVRAL
jgi:hypothetical protein